ncbi:MAG: radical SAM protein [Myxococcales bacterium]|nr:radical SAM protein [Myxococcales bacterium]
MSLTVLYRGPLSSCNYGCEYCPFAKRHETAEEHAADGAALSRFVAWALGRTHSPLRVFFTPWGEALTQVRYHEAMIRLSHASHMERVAVQTNLSARLDWLTEAKAERVGVWATFHPAWTTMERFLAQTERLRARGVHFSVGVVGFPEHRAAITALRAALPASTYVWINAVKKLVYAEDDVRFFESIDPLFRLNLKPHPSLGRACQAGETVIAVDGDGVARRCHFIPEAIGNIYQAGFEQALRPRPCTNATCGCHIGYVHLDYLELGKVFGAGLLERVPVHFSASSISQR